MFTRSLQTISINFTLFSGDLHSTCFTLRFVSGLTLVLFGACSGVVRALFGHCSGNVVFSYVFPFLVVFAL